MVRLLLSNIPLACSQKDMSANSYMLFTCDGVVEEFVGHPRKRMLYEPVSVKNPIALSQRAVYSTVAWSRGSKLSCCEIKTQLGFDYKNDTPGVGVHEERIPGATSESEWPARRNESGQSSYESCVDDAYVVVIAMLILDWSILHAGKRANFLHVRAGPLPQSCKRAPEGRGRASA